MSEADRHWIELGNTEPDGRMLVTDSNGDKIFVVSTAAIDRLGQAISTRCGSEGTGAPFRINLATGRIEDL